MNATENTALVPESIVTGDESTVKEYTPNDFYLTNTIPHMPENVGPNCLNCQVRLQIINRLIDQGVNLEISVDHQVRSNQLRPIHYAYHNEIIIGLINKIVNSDI